MNGKRNTLILYFNNAIEKWVTDFSKNIRVVAKDIIKEQHEFPISIAETNPVSIEGLYTLIVIISANDDIEKINSYISQLKNNQSSLRFYVILKGPNKSGKDLFEHIACFKFFDKSGYNSELREYVSTTNNETASLYWSKVIDIASSLFIKNEKIKGRVYLADTAPELYTVRDAIKRELNIHGYETLPETYLNPNSSNISNAIINDLKKCDISVHILHNIYSDVPQNSDLSITELQYKLSKDIIKSEEVNDVYDIKRILWLTPDTVVKDERQKRFLFSVRSEERATGNELIQVPVVDLKLLLLQKLKELSETKENIKTEEDKTYLYLMFEKKDSEKAEEIIKRFKSKGVEVLTQDNSKQSNNIVSQHYENLSKASTIIVIDSKNPFWLKSKIKDLMKAPGFGRIKPLESQIVLTDNPEQLDFISNNSGIEILDYKKGLELISFI